MILRGLKDNCSCLIHGWQHKAKEIMQVPVPVSLSGCMMARDESAGLKELFVVACRLLYSGFYDLSQIILAKSQSQTHS
jgi:hypothetical protein